MKNYDGTGQSNMHKKWKLAVLRRWNHECSIPSCTERDLSNLICWHLIAKNENDYLRYNIRNGIVFCKGHHLSIESARGEKIIKDLIGYDYEFIVANKDRTLAEHLVYLGVDEKKFLSDTLTDLKLYADIGEIKYNKGE